MTWPSGRGVAAWCYRAENPEPGAAAADCSGRGTPRGACPALCAAAAPQATTDSHSVNHITLYHLHCRAGCLIK